MGELCEFEIDFEQFDELRAVVVHDECGAHEDVWFYRFDGLKAENAKLRNEVDNLLDFEHLTSIAVTYAGCDECGEYKQTMLRLFAENDKLRKMLSELYEDQCDDCDKWKYRDRMRELGVGE